ncbi:MAG TPA: hypothetical protein VK590_01540 [Saprospiraceae bacterium]|nr:hypothetical protein [Saprospiraceae bacterium]
MDRKLLSVKITSFPENQKLKDFNSFSVSISAPKGFLNTRHINQEKLIAKLSIKGFQKVTDNDDFIMDVVISDKVIVENSTTFVNKLDRGGKNYKEYFIKYKFYIPISVRLLYYKGSVIYSEEITNEKNIKAYTSDAYTSMEELNKDFKYQFYKKEWILITDYLNSAFDLIPDRLSSKFGFGETAFWAQTYRLDSKKHPEYDAYMMAFDTMKLILKSVKSGCNVAEFQNRAIVPIKYFEDLASKLSKTDKEQSKLLEATLINLMNIYFFTDQFDKFRLSADKLLALNEKGDNEKYKVKDLEMIYDKMDEVNCTSIYYVRPPNGELSKHKFNRDSLSSVVSIQNLTVKDSVLIEQDTIVFSEPISEDSYDVSKLKNDPTDFVYRGSYTDKEAKVIKGYFVISGSDQENLRFYNSGQNISFIHLVDDKPQKLNTNPESFTTLALNKRKFKSVLYKDSKDLLSKIEPAIMEVLVENPKIEMYLFQSVKFTNKEDPAPWVFSVKGHEKLLTISQKDLFWKKKVKEIFGDCPSINQDIEYTKVWQLSKDLFIDWCNRYGKCGK